MSINAVKIVAYYLFRCKHPPPTILYPNHNINNTNNKINGNRKGRRKKVTTCKLSSSQTTFFHSHFCSPSFFVSYNLFQFISPHRQSFNDILIGLFIQRKYSSFCQLSVLCYVGAASMCV